MNKITVGHAPSPNVSKATSKIGSLSNTSYKPSGGRVKIEQRKLEWNAKSRVGSLGNLGHVAGGGAVKVGEVFQQFYENCNVFWPVL